MPVAEDVNVLSARCMNTRCFLKLRLATGRGNAKISATEIIS